MQELITQWAARHGVTAEAIADLQKVLVVEPQSRGIDTPEAEVQARVRLEAAKAGARLWRNNVGAALTEDGRFIRYGLANESERQNSHLKSSDLIGVKPRLITSEDVGHVIGQFVAREVKRGGWRFTGTEREQAQLRFLKLVYSLGGDACFVTGEGSL